LQTTKNNTTLFSLLLLATLCMVLLNISLGSVAIPVQSIFTALTNGETSNENWQFIIQNIRLPKTITAILVGSGLSVAGLLMQTLFRNPLAGPFVLGISSGASLGVAIVIFGLHFFGNVFVFQNTNFGISIAACIGSFAVLFIIMLAAKKIRNTMSVLIIGLMFASFASAFISILAYFGTAEQVQQFMFWGFGSLSNLSWKEVGFLAFIYVLSMLLVIVVIKPLNSMLLGENYAKSLGVNISKTRLIILIATSLLTGIITAFVGPIAFIGLAVPHITKMVFISSNHKTLIPAVALFGAISMLVCDSIAQMPFSESMLPINAITSLLGAPIVIWLIVKKRNIIV